MTQPHHDPLAGTQIASSVLATIGHTPIIALPQLKEAEQLRCTIAVKQEASNPGGSAKDRAALSMVLDAEAKGLLKPGGTIVEPTSGNTGVGLAIVAAQRGYNCVFVVTDKVAPEKVSLLRAYGAEVVVCPVAVAPDDPRSYYKVAERLTHERNAFRPNQYANPANPAAHTATTGPEIWEQTAGRITHFVAGAGTCGTITGVARYLKSKNPDIKIIAADPEGSLFSGGNGRPYLVEGIGEDFYPAAYDRDLYDEVIAISDAESFRTARYVSAAEGILIGGSGGTAMAAALRVARELPEDALVVVLNPDSGRGYLSRVFNDEWMARNGFTAGNEESVAQVVASREAYTAAQHNHDLVFANPHEAVRDVIARMHEHGISQLAICENQPPFAIAEMIGSVDELNLLGEVRRRPEVLDQPVSDVMAARLPLIGIGESIEALNELLHQNDAVVVTDGGRPRVVLTRSDLLAYLQN